MAQVVADAILVKCADGLGQLTTYANTAIGLSGGYMAIITGRLGLDGTKTITGDTAITHWYEDLLAEESGDFQPSRRIDLVEGGNTDNVSSMSFTFLNTAGLAALLEANGVYLQRCEVSYFRVSTMDFVTFNFRQRWFGLIDDQPFTETKQQIQCVSSDKAVYKSEPTAQANPTAYPLAPSESKDKYIPIAMGRIGYSPLVNIKGAGQKTTLAIISGASYPMAACVYVDGTRTIIRIKTNGVTFLANDARLVGKYLNQIDGSQTPPPIRIGSNLVTNTSDPSNPYTQITIDDEIPGTPILWSLINETDRPWFFEVLDLSVTLIAAGRPIAEVVKNASGRPVLSVWSGDEDRFNDISEASFKSSTTSIEATGLPGYSCRAKSKDTTGQVEFPIKIVPASVTVAGVPTGTNTFPALNAACPLLNDTNQGTGYVLQGSLPGLDSRDSFSLFLNISEADAGGAFEALYVLPRFTAVADAGTVTVGISMTVRLIDLYGRALTTGIDHHFPIGALDTTGIVYNMLPQFYFGLPDDSAADANYNTARFPLDISALVSDAKIANIYKKIDVAFSLGTVGTGNYHFTLQEIGLVAVKNANLTTETLYGAIKGETYGSTWNGRKTAGDPVERPHEWIEKLIRDYDLNADLWIPSKAYLKGRRVRSSADNGHIFLCTTGGTSGGTEPTWTGAAGATYTDGSVIWKEVGAVPVDESSFDSLNVLLFNWRMGYTLQDPKPTEDLVRMLCRHAWIAAITDRFGKVKVKSWLDTGIALADFNKTNIYGGSLRDGITYSPSSRAYSVMRFNYDFNPATKKYNRQVAIKNIDKPAFPAPGETVSTGIALGSFTATYSELEGGLFQITIVTTLVHGIQSGEYVGLAGNANGYNFAARPPASIAGLFTFSVFVSGNVFTALSSTSGQLTRYTDRRYAWHDYVSGIENYAEAKSLWDPAHAGFMITKVPNEMPEDLGNLPFFLDPYATDANGNLLWPDMDVGDNHATTFHAQRAVEWLPYLKPQAYIEVIDDGTFDYLELVDPITLADDKETGGVAARGWVCEITPLPKTDTDPHRIRFGLILKPGSLGNVSEFDTIDEMGATDYVDEAGATDYVDDGG